jgi:cation/acetate symporter
MLEAAADMDKTHAEPWSAFQSTVLPAAAQAAGNKKGLLTLGALTLDPVALVFVVPAMVGGSNVIAGLLFAGALAAALATGGGLLLTLGNALGHDGFERMLGGAGPAPRQVAAARMLLCAVAVLAALAAALRPPDVLVAATSAFSLCAAALFPALVLGLWWRRANAWGAVAGMIVGLAVSTAYLLGTQYFAVDFYDAAGQLSNASEAAARKFASLKAAWEAAAAGDAKAQAWAALEAHARGTPLRAGVANWFGVNGVSAALFALPAGFLVVVALSLVTPARRHAAASRAPSTRA